MLLNKWCQEGKLTNWEILTTAKWLNIAEELYQMPFA